MNKIQKISLYNTPVSGTDIELVMEEGKNVLILTGANGSGKSRTIAVLLESLSLLRDVDHSVTSYDWITEILFEGGLGVRAVRMSSKHKSGTSFREEVTQAFTSAESLKQAYEDVEAVINRHTPPSGFKSKDDGEGRAFACLGVAAPSVEDSDHFSKSSEVVAFIDSEIYFSAGREIDEAVMNGHRGIDQTLYMLFYEHAVRLAENPTTFDSIYTLLKEFEEKGGAHGDREAAKKYVQSKIDPELMQSTVNAFEQTEAFVELNKFFALTNRRLKWSNKHAFMILENGDEVAWTAFSKGEKTLLALLLIVHLYKDNATFLFDEPDLSLHMEWQRMLIPALIKLAPNSQFIISTHSPFMVMNTQNEQIVNMVNFHRSASSRG